MSLITTCILYPLLVAAVCESPVVEARTLKSSDGRSSLHAATQQPSIQVATLGKNSTGIVPCDAVISPDGLLRGRIVGVLAANQVGEELALRCIALDGKSWTTSVGRSGDFAFRLDKGGLYLLQVIDSRGEVITQTVARIWTTGTEPPVSQELLELHLVGQTRTQTAGRAPERGTCEKPHAKTEVIRGAPPVRRNLFGAMLRTTFVVGTVAWPIIYNSVKDDDFIPAHPSSP